MHPRLCGPHLGDLRLLQGDFAFQVGDPLGDLAGQVLVALGHRGAGRALVALGLFAEALQLLLQDPPAGDQRRQVVPRLGQGRVRVADLLVEDAQGVGVDHGGSGVVGAAAQQGEQLVPHRHGGLLRLDQATREKFWRRSEAASMAFSASIRSSITTVCRVVLHASSPKIS